MISVRNVLLTIAILFTGYFAARGIWLPAHVENRLLMAAAVVLQLAVTGICLFVPGRRAERAPTHLPTWAAAVTLATAALLPLLVSLAVAVDRRGTSDSTWYLGAVGAIMTFVVVRRRPFWAWGGIAVLTVMSAWGMGLPSALAQGLIGSIVWVGAAQLLLLFTDRAYRDTVRLAELQQAASAWQTTQTVRRRERRERVQYALTVAGPMLSRVIAGGGVLTAEERVEAQLAEGRLRDELRGARLLDDGVRAAIEAARRRGATVTVFDEGGLEGLADDGLAVVRRELAEALREVTAARVIIRTAPDAEIAVTVVGRSAVGTGLTDEDSVNLWREIPLPD